ncbi:MAG: redoxin domain-containing protein, partial [Bacteroidetes bacterium]|nr:redoxin domain-containing protein [Bacteroidota bacterium]
MQNNKFLKVTWLALVLLISNYAAKASATDTLKLGQRVIGFNLHNVVEGEKSQVSLEDYQNKKGVIVVFMTNGCYHCILYRERIKAFQKDYAAKGYQLITINPSNPTYAKEETTEEMIKNAK